MSTPIEEVTDLELRRRLREPWITGNTCPYCRTWETVHSANRFGHKVDCPWKAENVIREFNRRLARRESQSGSGSPRPRRRWLLWLPGRREAAD